MLAPQIAELMFVIEEITVGRIAIRKVRVAAAPPVEVDLGPLVTAIVGNRLRRDAEERGVVLGMV